MPSSSHNTDELVGLPAVAERLGVHRATVNDMVRSKRLRARRRGAHWFVLKADLDSFADSYVRPANAPAPRATTPLPQSTPMIVEILQDVQSADAVEIARMIDLHEGNVRKHLRLLEADGLVTRDAAGQWRLRAAAVGFEEPTAAAS